MIDEVSRSCSTCAHGGTEADTMPCAECIKYTEPWKPHWKARGLTPEAKQMANDLMDGVYARVAAAKGQGNTPEAMAVGGVKYDGDKPRMDLLDGYAIEQLALVLAFGAKKYDAHNWRKGIAKGRLIAAALRHLFAYLKGEDKDPETGLSHAAHAMCCCMFLLGLEHRIDLDDRWKEATP